jgi:hypothetical protein
MIKSFIMPETMAFGGQEFCSGELWNQNLTWYTDSPDFTSCFHKTVLVYLPCAFLWLLSPFEVRFNFISSRQFSPWTFLNVTKLASSSLLALISILELIHLGILNKNEDADKGIELADFVSSGIKLATYLLLTFLILSGRRAGLYFNYFSIF